MYNYFISYKCHTKEGTGDSNIEYKIDHKISSFEDIEYIQKVICKEMDYDSCLITNFREFDK